MIAAHKDTEELIVDFIKCVMNENKFRQIWMNEEIPLGLSAAFALAYYVKEHIQTFIELLRTFNLNFEVYEEFFMQVLLNKWGKCEETIALLAARAGSLSGQWGIENLEFEALSDDEKVTYVHHMFEDSLHSEDVYNGNLMDAMEFLQIPFSKDSFVELFKHTTPLYTKENIPKHEDIQ